MEDVEVVLKHEFWTVSVLWPCRRCNLSAFDVDAVAFMEGKLLGVGAVIVAGDWTVEDQPNRLITKCEIEQRLI